MSLAETARHSDLMRRRSHTPTATAGAVWANIAFARSVREGAQEKVESGRCNNASEVAREALRLLEQQDELRQIQIERLREAIHLGEQQAVRGKFGERTVDQTLASTARCSSASTCRHTSAMR